MGLGETMEDRIDMCLDLRKLGVKSTPVNVLNAIPGTPYENLPKLTNDEFCRIVAIYRFINPKAFIRLAGGRGVLGDDGKRAFKSGANAAITDDMLTTAGVAAVPVSNREPQVSRRDRPTRAAFFCTPFSRTFIRALREILFFRRLIHEYDNALSLSCKSEAVQFSENDKKDCIAAVLECFWPLSPQRG